MPETPASISSSDADLETNAESAPAFARFPWIQLVFCIACLSMTAWTWMRYSYTSDVTVPGLYGGRAVTANLDSLPPDDVGRYVRVSGYYRGPEKYGSAFLCEHNSKRQVILHVPLDRTSSDERVTVVGRVYAHARHYVGVDTSASRLHGASIAGLVVGAMGCFIFGLYLRAWLRERKVIAGQQGQPIIA